MSGKKLAQTATFVLLPVRGLRSDEMRSVGSNTRAFANAASSRFEVLADTAPREPTMRLIHSIGETGPKLVEMGAEEIAAMRVSDPGVRAVPVVLYELARRPIFEVEATVDRCGVGHFRRSLERGQEGYLSRDVKRNPG